MDSSISNKFNVFFEDLKAFLIRTGMSEASDITGATTADIEEFEQRYALVFPTVLRSYLRYFGKTCDVKRDDYDFDITLYGDPNDRITPCIREVQESIQQKGVEILSQSNPRVNVPWLMSEDEVKEGDYTPYIKDVMDVNNALFFWTMDMADAFMDRTKENSIVFWLMQKTSIASSGETLGEHFKRRLFIRFSSLSHEFDNMGGSRDMTKLSLNIFETDWLQEYIYIYICNDYQVSIKDDRFFDEYIHVNRKIEEQTGRFTTVDEFFIGFMGYLKEKGFKFSK